MTKFRTLYEFFIDKEELVDEEQIGTDEAGNPTKTITQVKKVVPVPFCLARPNRQLIDDADLFFNVTVSKGIQAGLLSAALLSKRFSNDGGILSDQEKKDWADKFLERFKKEEEIQKLNLKTEKTPEETEQHDSLIKEIASLNRELHAFEFREQSLFDITAESRARTRTIIWWVLFLLNKKDKKSREWVSFFDGETLAEKQNSYDELGDEESYPDEKEREFIAKVVNHAMQAVALWFYGRASKQGEFLKAIEETQKLTG